MKAALIFVTLLGSLSPGLMAEGPMRATHILGFEGLSNNASGDLSVQGDTLRFQGREGRMAQISIGSIQDIFLGEQDKQVGGTPMALGRAATPFGGGRVISLFSHKKYDTLTLTYLDAEGGRHGTILQLNKGQGEAFKDKLVAGGAHVNTAEVKNENQ